MLHSVLNFITGTAATAGTVSNIDDINMNCFSTLDVLIKYGISLLAGILSTININILKKKFPEWPKPEENFKFLTHINAV